MSITKERIKVETLSLKRKLSESELEKTSLQYDTKVRNQIDKAKANYNPEETMSTKEFLATL